MSTEIKTLKRFVQRGFVTLAKREDGSYIVTRKVNHQDDKWKASWFHLQYALCDNFDERRPSSDGTNMCQSFAIDPRWLTPERVASLEQVLNESPLVC